MSELIEVRAADLIGVPLDWAVSQIEGIETSWRHGRELVKVHDGGGIKLIESIRPIYSPSTDWSQAGPLIEKYRPDLGQWDHCGGKHDGKVSIGAGLQVPGAECGCEDRLCNCGAWVRTHSFEGSYLVSFCRALVILSRGKVVRVPAELIQQ